MQGALGKVRTDAEKGETGRGVRRGGTPPVVITLSIRPQDGPHQPTGLMVDRIIRKLSQPVITGAHLARKDFHSLSVTNTRTHKQAGRLRWAAVQDARLMEWGGGPVYMGGSERVYTLRWRTDRSTDCRGEPVLPGF